MERPRLLRHLVQRPSLVESVSCTLATRKAPVAQADFTRHSAHRLYVFTGVPCSHTAQAISDLHEVLLLQLVASSHPAVSALDTARAGTAKCAGTEQLG